MAVLLGFVRCALCYLCKHFRVLAWASCVLLIPGSAMAESKVDCGPKQDGNARAVPFFFGESMLYKGKPDLRQYGIHTLTIIDRGFWKEGRIGQEADPDRIRDVVAKIPRSDLPLILDIEAFKFDGEEATALSNSNQLSTIIHQFRDATPGRRIGLYGVIPIRDYWRALKGPGDAAYMKWQAQNDRLRELASQSDIIFPSIYTFYEDREGWVRYATAQICEARRIAPDKPIYVFLWNEYHDSNRMRPSDFLESSYWRVQLETAFRFADGVVIWGGFDIPNHKQRDWDERGAWWQVTKAFAERVRINPRALE